ncbi:MAG: hypothetical protein EXS13_15160 [Planctomycetes bacterium]|nr:hypothetical protein [Planctomycetota bacterium]
MSDPNPPRRRHYHRVAVVAEWFEVDVALIEEAVVLHLLDDDATAPSPDVLADESLDRLAIVLRYRWLTGFDLAAIALLVPTHDEHPR